MAGPPQSGVLGTVDSSNTFDPEEILDREEQNINLLRLGSFLAGKRVLITGAAGTIGSALSRAVFSAAPERLTVLDHNEYGLYTLRMKLDELNQEQARSVILGDVRDYERLKSVFMAESPEIIFHVAALKHVGMVEENPSEGAATNILGTQNVSRAAQACGARAMVLISTDKAVLPHNIMGATKKIAEEMCRMYDMAENNPTRHIVVRFGNVFGSSGSVVPLFAHQIEKRLPLTITHPDVRRFFMTEREAVALVLEALQIGLENDKTRGGIFFHDMGLGIPIAEIAHRMITSKGLRPNVDIPVVITSLRPGEKLFENILAPGEIAETLEGGQTALARGKIVPKHIETTLKSLEAACRLSDDVAVCRMLHAYMHNDDNKGRSADKGTVSKVTSINVSGH